MIRKVVMLGLVKVHCNTRKTENSGLVMSSG